MDSGQNWAEHYTFNHLRRVVEVHVYSINQYYSLFSGKYVNGEKWINRVRQLRLPTVISYSGFVCGTVKWVVSFTSVHLCVLVATRDVNISWLTCNLTCILFNTDFLYSWHFYGILLPTTFNLISRRKYFTFSVLCVWVRLHLYYIYTNFWT